MLDRIYHRLTTINPLWYLATYVVAPWLYAALYAYALHNGFHAPYAKLEPTATLDRMKARDLLVPHLELMLNEIAADNKVHKYVPSIDHVSATPIDDGEALAITIYLCTNNIVESEHGGGGGDCGSVKATIAQDPPIGGEAGHWWLEWKDLAHVRGVLGEHVRFIHPIKLSPADAATISRYFEGAGGNPMRLSGAYGRMVYFSYITITTVGFGDIVPLTSAARWWVASEAVLGVILAGLFVSAVFTRVGNKRCARSRGQ